MVFEKIMVIGILSIIGLAAMGFVISTIKLGQKLIGQFKCSSCGKYNKALSGKCEHCNKTMTKGLYKYKSTFFGKVKIKNKKGVNELNKAIKWIVIDATLLSLISALIVLSIIKLI